MIAAPLLTPIGQISILQTAAQQHAQQPCTAACTAAMHSSHAQQPLSQVESLGLLGSQARQVQMLAADLQLLVFSTALGSPSEVQQICAVQPLLQLQYF